MSAQTGRDALEWMKSQAEVTNAWAGEDRSRFQNTFIPLQDQFIKDAQEWDSPQRRQAAAAEAASEVSIAGRLAQGQNLRRAMSMGINPASGAFAAADRRVATDTALARAGAVNLANRRVDAEADAKMANAINLGSGLAVNPATSMSISNGAGQAGFGAAMQGYNQQASILNTDYQNRMQSWQADQQGMAGLFGAAGQLAGAFLPQLFAMSSKRAKTDKTPVRKGAALDAVRKMPVEEWTYKPGIADGGRHVGPYAEDFRKATGKGDGTTIPIVDALGVTMGAVKDLDAKVSKLLKGSRPSAARRAA